MSTPRTTLLAVMGFCLTLASCSKKDVKQDEPLMTPDVGSNSGLAPGNVPVDIRIGPAGVTTRFGPSRLAPQATFQGSHQIKYDGSKVFGKHTVRFGFGYNRIQGGGFASFFKIAPQFFGFSTAGSDPTQAPVLNRAACCKSILHRTRFDNVFSS